MTTATLDRAARPGSGHAGGRYGFRSVARMEWLKLRSVRSTWWTLLVFAAGMIGLAVLIMAHYNWATMPSGARAGFDPTNDSLAGLAIGQLALGVLGVLAITSGKRFPKASASDSACATSPAMASASAASL